MKSIIKNKYFAYAGALICTMLWGTAFPLIKLGYAQLGIESNDIGSKLLFAGERFLIAGILVLLFGLATKPRSMKIKRTSLLPIVSLGFVQTFLQYLFSYAGVGFTTATNTSVITGTISLISVIMAGIFFKSDRITPLKIAGCIIGFAGIFLINAGNFSFSVGLFGDFLVLMSAVSGAGGNIITKRVTENCNPTCATALQLSIGGIFLLITGFALGGFTDLSKPQALVTLLWLSFVSAVSFLLWTALLKHHPVSKITAFTMLIPIFGTAWSGIILGESILRYENLIALALVSAGIVMVNLNFARKR